MKGWMYILECADNSYYTGSSNNLELRIQQHQNGEGANHTKERLPVKLVYAEEFERIDQAFYREKQVQGWSRRKKEALIKGEHNKLPQLSKNYTQFSPPMLPERVEGSNTVASASSATNGPLPEIVTPLPEPVHPLPEPVHPLPEPVHSLPEPVEGNITAISTTNTVASTSSATDIPLSENITPLAFASEPTKPVEATLII